MGTEIEVIGWRPIKTHDGSSRAVLVWVPENKCIYCVTWQPGGEFKRGWSVFGGGWRDTIQGATHWQPLPEPPHPNTGRV